MKSLIFFIAFLLVIHNTNQLSLRRSQQQQALLQTSDNLACMTATEVTKTQFKLTNTCGRDVDFRDATLLINSNPILSSVWGQFGALSYPAVTTTVIPGFAQVKFTFDVGSWIKTKLATGTFVLIQYYVDQFALTGIEFHEAGSQAAATQDANSIYVSFQLPAKPVDVVPDNFQATLTKNGDATFKETLTLKWGAITKQKFNRSMTQLFKLIPDTVSGTGFQYFFPGHCVNTSDNYVLNVVYNAKKYVTAAISAKALGLPAEVSLSKVNLQFYDETNGQKYLYQLGQTLVLPVGHRFTVSSFKFNELNNVYYKPTGYSPLQFTLFEGQQVNVDITFQKFDSTGPSVRGWPKYLAHGAVTDIVNSETFIQRPVDSIFKYAGNGGNGDRGQIVYPIYTKNTAKQALGLTESTKRRVIPVMVIYTAEMSGGTNVEDYHLLNLAKHFANLIMESEVMQETKDPSAGTAGSFILNADLMGMIQQNNLLAADGPFSNFVIENNKALKIALCFARGKHTYKGAQYDYKQLFAEMRKTVYSDWDVLLAWHEEANKLFDACFENSNLDNSVVPPVFEDSFGGWTLVTNWIIKYFGPDVTFGWMENVWSTGSGNFVHKDWADDKFKSFLIDPTVNKWKSLKTYEEPYRPDFFVFDKYEHDAFKWCYTIGFLWNNRDMLNYIKYAKMIGEGLANIPVMLWQIPGGHLQGKTNDPDTRERNGSTEPDWFFGNDNLGTNLSNVKDYIKESVLPETIYGTTSVTTYLSNYDWNTNNLWRAVDANVFAILWGGGQTTSVGAFPQDDGGWLSNKIKKYYLDPLPVKTQV